MSLVELRNIIQSFTPYITQETQHKEVMLDISVLLFWINSHPYTFKHIIHSYISNHSYLQNITKNKYFTHK